MLCSKCKKNQATIFINEPTKEDKNHLVGYCNSCAKEKGISVDNGANNSSNINNIGNINLDQMASQFGVIFKDLTNSINNENIDIEAINGEGGIPIGSIFGMFGGNPNTESSHETSSSNKKVKVEKRPKDKKRKFLDTYGTNLTVKAKNNQIDTVIGRDKEIK